MQKGSALIYGMSLWVLLSLTLEETAQAKQFPAKIQSSFENRATLNSSRDPRQELNAWQTQATPAAPQASTTAVQAKGLSAIENLKSQASQFSNSLRLTGGVGEGRFDPPGLFEFSSFLSRTNSNPSDDSSKADEGEKLRVATIQSIEKILKQSNSSAQRVELLLRLAELHAERHSYLLQKEMSQYEIAYEKWLKNMRNGAEPKFNQTMSLQSINAATQILRALVNQYPNHNRAPEALYQLGFLLTEMKSDSAVLYFQRLIERFPKSRYIADAQLALGEFYFSRNNFSEALGHYQKALQDRKNRAYPYAVYKLGWTFFNIRGSDEETSKNLQKSLTAFRLLVKIADEASAEQKLTLLRKDALRDMVLVYAELGDITEAQAYFKEMKEPALYATLLERLAWLHAEAGRCRESAELYLRLVQEFPDSAKNPQFLVRLAGLYEKDQQRELMVDALERVSEMISANSQWSAAQKNPRDKTTAKEALIAEATLWSIRLHAEFQKTQNKKTAQESLQLYDLALKHHGETSAAFQIHFNRAQLLTALGDHERAIEGYIRAALLDRKLALKRSESKVGLENAMAESDLLIQARPAITHKNQGLPPLENRLVKIIELHTQMFPKDSNKISHLHRAALLHFQAGLVPQAGQRWMAMAKEDPQSRLVSDGLRLLIKRSFDGGDWLKAAQDARTFLAIPGISSAAVGGQLAKLLRVAIFQQAQVVEKSGRHLEAAQQFLDFQKQFPTDNDAAKALINAANNQFKGNRPEDALSTLGRFVNQYPKSEYQTQALEMMAATAEALARFADAAKALEQLAELRGNAREQQGLDLQHAAQLRLAEGNTTRTISNAQSALLHLKRGSDICETYKTLVDAQSMAKLSTLTDSARSAAQRCQNSSPEWGLYFAGTTARLLMSAGQTNEATQWASLAVSRGRVWKGKLQNPFAFEGLRLAGLVQLEVLEAQSRALRSKKILQGKNLQVEFSKIRTEAQSLAQQYVQLSQAGQSETSVGALYRVAELQELLANILMQAPNPEGISASEVEAFKAKIEKIALPLQEEAIRLYSQALEKAHEAEVVSQHTALLQEKLAVVRPGEFQKLIEVMPKPSYMAHELPINKEMKGVVQDE